MVPKIKEKYIELSQKIFQPIVSQHVLNTYWADDKQSKARNSDSKYRQMALVGFDT